VSVVFREKKKLEGEFASREEPKAGYPVLECTQVRSNAR
jgi:hypothetical protein